MRMMRAASRRPLTLRRAAPLALAIAACLPGFAQAREISVQEAVVQAQREADGKVLSVQTLNLGKRKIYRIKVLTRDGTVRVVQIQAEQ